MTKTAWILTEEYNEYDQYGEYFVKAFGKKPDVKRLAAFFTENGSHGTYSNPMQALDFLLHVEAGGGRQGVENHWYNLVEVDLE